jgi:phosphate transport system substrate-binding protein
MEILHFPATLGAVVPIYNVAGLRAPLRFTGDVLAGIFLGTITKWNDAKLAAANPGVKLPGGDIVVVHRSDGSGTTYIWTDYLSKVSPAWKQKVGANTSPNWPTGLGAGKNDGVAAQVKQTAGSIGYVELIYAMQNRLSFGSVRNAAGDYVTASLAGVSAAAAGAANNMPADFRVSITNAPGKGAYPISSFTWLLIPTQIKDAAKKRVIVDFLKWMLKDGQGFAEGLLYSQLPAPVIAKERAAIAKVK